jgi:hypothetical protein
MRDVCVECAGIVSRRTRCVIYEMWAPRVSTYTA